jgi:hypothetical protein
MRHWKSITLRITALAGVFALANMGALAQSDVKIGVLNDQSSLIR